jgi:hypothetical protein
MDAVVLPKEVAQSEVVSELREAVTNPGDGVSSLARFAASSGDRAMGDPFVSIRGEKNLARPKHLLSESVRKGDGIGPVVSLDEYCSKLLVVTLGITDVVERTGLTVSVWGSPDQAQWGAKPLITFRQRQYCGVYSVLLNMSMHTDVRYLRVQWNTHLWGKGERTPLFGFQVFLEESGARVRSPAVA